MFIYNIEIILKLKSFIDVVVNFVKRKRKNKQSGYSVQINKKKVQLSTYLQKIKKS